LNEVIEEWLDDFSAMSDASDLRVKSDLTPGLYIAGERRYTSLIVQNLLENARKYNRAGGKIEITAQASNGFVVLRIGNSGRGISAEAEPFLFERFHRGANHNGVPGHGLGLNLARDLARLHGGDLRLVRSGEDWTEFEVRFRAKQFASSNASA
jgi:signal transduction histidine kinase